MFQRIKCGFQFTRRSYDLEIKQASFLLNNRYRLYRCVWIVFILNCLNWVFSSAVTVILKFSAV